ncbi:MAG TPA: hypothetical protein P5081_19615 [Phycisphaerae bacterium]|nr:hypothetical protein [Phycisphaerae bacterium]HRW55085.1 hypothetical protein [Phycisphaerae bacterium]
MKKSTLRRVKIARTVAIFVAAAPLFQLSQCTTFSSMVGQTVVNGLPNLFFSTFQSLLLLPLQSLLASI